MDDELTLNLNNCHAYFSDVIPQVGLSIVSEMRAEKYKVTSTYKIVIVNLYHGGVYTSAQTLNLTQCELVVFSCLTRLDPCNRIDNMCMLGLNNGKSNEVGNFQI